VGSESFEAQLFDPAHRSVVEHAEFSIRELPPDGLKLLRPGAVFYWMIGYRDLGSRQRKRESVIWMRRSGRMGQDKFQAALEHIETIWNDLISDADAVTQREASVGVEMAEAATGEEGRFVAQQGKVLLVEDEDRERAFNAHGLASRGYDVIEASNGVEALTKLEQQHVDVIVLDLAMPLDGLTLLEQLRKVTPKVPVVLISPSGYADVLEEALARKEWPNILHRPFDPDELFTVVAHAMPIARDDWRRR
jgi:CheY-like chemotaxis protein